MQSDIRFGTPMYRRSATPQNVKMPQSGHFLPSREFSIGPTKQAERLPTKPLRIKLT